MYKEIEVEDWNFLRNKKLKNKKVKAEVQKSYNEYDTFHLENDFDR
jgi:hypothetical protein